jgi:hypothetical protein
LAAKFQITPEEERAWAGSDAALLSYFDIVGQTPGLKEIMFKTVDLPSIWSLVWHAGAQASISLPSGPVTPANAADCACPSNAPAYLMPMRIDLNGHHALNVVLLVTAPQPPLLACGGIVGLLAENPADNENYLTINVISARRGPGTTVRTP